MSSLLDVMYALGWVFSFSILIGGSIGWFVSYLERVNADE